MFRLIRIFRLSVCFGCDVFSRSLQYQGYMQTMINHVNVKQMAPKTFGVPIDSIAFNLFLPFLVGFCNKAYVV